MIGQLDHMWACQEDNSCLMSGGLLSSVNKLIFAKVCENVNFNNMLMLQFFLQKERPWMLWN